MARHKARHYMCTVMCSDSYEHIYVDPSGDPGYPGKAGPKGDQGKCTKFGTY